MSNSAWWYYSSSFTCSFHSQWPWPHFKVTAVSNRLNWKFYVLISLSWNFIGLSSTSSRSRTHHLFWWARISKGDNWYISSFEKNFNIGFLSDTFKAKSFKLCRIITLLGIYIVVLGVMTLTFLQGHRCVRNINCKLHILDSCSL